MSLLTLNKTQFGGPVTTEWDDALRRHGIIPPLEEDAAAPSADEPQPVAPTSASASSAPADAEDDEGDEDSELARLRAERLAELKGSGVASGRFGTVQTLKRDDYMAEVNQAGEGVGVVVFLFKPRHYLSAYTLVLIEQLARRHAHVKFMQIESNECIPDYPDRNLPTLLVYRDDDLLGQCVGASAFGGSARSPSSFGIDDIEWELAQLGVIETALTQNPHATART